MLTALLTLLILQRIEEEVGQLENGAAGQQGKLLLLSLVLMLRWLQCACDTHTARARRLALFRGVVSTSSAI